MLKIYVKAAWRNLTKTKLYSAINITGLAVGLAGFIVILLFLNYELSYDTWHSSLQKVYKVSARTNDEVLEQTPAPLSSFLKQNIPYIEASTKMQPAGDFKILVSTTSKKIYEGGSVEADSSFFKVFPYKLVQGNAAMALNKPNAIVISRQLSEKLFDKENPLGKIVKLFNTTDLEVTGVMEAAKTPSHLNVQFVWRSPYEKQNLFWENQSYQTYIRTKTDVKQAELEEKLNNVYYNERLKQNNLSLQDFRKAGHTAGLFTDAVPEIHNFPKQGKSNFTTVSILLLLAGLLLVAGAINFSNLSVAASVHRAREVGVRKVLGSSRRQLFWQFVTEIGLQCLLSLCIALVIVSFVLPYFNREFGSELRLFTSSDSLSLFTQIAGCLLLVIFLSGFYPAIFLSRHNVSKVLKGDYSTGTKGIAFRNSLLVLQFIVSAFFIIATIIIQSQLHYMQTKDKGFSGAQVLRLETLQKNREAGFGVLKNNLEKIPGVQYVSKTTTVPGDATQDTSTYAFKYKGNEYRMSSVKVSDDYFNTLGIKLKEGRLFTTSYADQNTRSAVINETAAATLNLQNPVGAFIFFPQCDTVPVQIVGVVKDFTVSGFERSIQPVVFTVGNKACMFQSGGAVLIKLNSNNLSQTIAAIEQAWKLTEPDYPIRYAFLDDNFQKLFASHLRLQKIISVFGFAAIFIAVMGLFALTAFLTSRRTKEIGIRKILGAGVGSLCLLLCKDFIRLVTVAVIIAIPAGWWAANKWLQSFAYRIKVDWWVFAATAVAVIGISVFVIGLQTIKAAVTNPVKNLRTE
jgi:putative ABC transport system permease protein